LLAEWLSRNGFATTVDVGRQPGQIVIRQGCDTFDETLDVDPDYPAAA
jgi:hypothetical protein